MKILYTFLMVVIVTACSKSLTYNEAIEKNLNTLETAEIKDDAQFLVEAKSLCILEEELGRLASTSGYAAETQSFAKKVAEDHREINDQIDDLASDHKIKVPAEMSGTHRLKYEEVQGTSREDFDEAFLNAMEEIYNSNVDLYESYATVANIDEIRMFAAEKLGLLRSNEEMADELEDDLIKN